MSDERGLMNGREARAFMVLQVITHHSSLITGSQGAKGRSVVLCLNTNRTVY